MAPRSFLHQLPANQRPRWDDVTLWQSVIVRLVSVVCCGGKSQAVRPAFGSVIFCENVTNLEAFFRALGFTGHIMTSQSPHLSAYCPYRRVWREP
jgi:hypothetical protein